MKLTYDPRYNIAYLRLHEKSANVETIHVSDELNVDVAPDGTVYGIELLNANEQLRGEDRGQADRGQRSPRRTAGSASCAPGSCSQNRQEVRQIIRQLSAAAAWPPTPFFTTNRSSRFGYSATIGISVFCIVSRMSKVYDNLVAQLYLHDREIKTVFDLLGSDENDITFSLGWGLAQSPSFRRQLLKDIFDRHMGEVAKVHLQKHGNKHGGYTDIEIETTTAHVIVEAKRWWNLPGKAQLEKYVPRFRKGKRSTIVVMGESGEAFGNWKLPKLNTTRTVYRSWKQIARLLSQSASQGTQAEKRLLRELTIYLRGLINMQNQQSNQVYVIALGNQEVQRWSGKAWRDWVIQERFFHQSMDEHWPKEPPNYLGFRYDGKLRAIHHVESYEIVNNLHGRVPIKHYEKWMSKPRHLCRLGPPIRLDDKFAPKSTGLWNTRVWAALDLLLTCKTISQARDKTSRRLSE